MADYDFTYTGAEIQEILDTGKKLKDSGYIFLGIATPSTNPGTPTQKVYYEAKQAGTYTNFGGIVLSEGLSLLIWNGNSWTSETMMYGDGGVFDISVYKSSGGTLATFADLSAALNGGNNIPASARKGGMSVKFVQSSDNKYVQFRYLLEYKDTTAGNAAFLNTDNWQGVDAVPTPGSNNLVDGDGIYTSINVTKGLCFEELTPDGNGYWGEGGVVTPYEKYRYKSIDATSLAGKELLIKVGSPNNIVAFSFVKLSDDSFVALETCVIGTVPTSGAKRVVLPDDAVRLDISWDYHNNIRPILSLVIDSNETTIRFRELTDEVTTIGSKVFSEIYHLIDISSPDYPGKYWESDGTLTTRSRYNAFEVDIHNYVGSFIEIKAGHNVDTINHITGLCWIKKTDNSIVGLNNFVTDFIVNQYAKVTVPADSDKLLISIDTTNYTTNPDWGEPFCKLDNVSDLDYLNIKSFPYRNKKIFLFGDSISSEDYPWYKEYLEQYTLATVYNQGASGRGAAYLASNAYFQRLATYPSDLVVALIGANDNGTQGTVGTFSATSVLAQMGESVVQETDISIDYNGTTFIQAISHTIRKWMATYYNFRLAANLTANILDTENGNEVVYPLSGTATETQCIAYAESQGWTLGYGQRYVMMSTETSDIKREKLMSMKHPKFILCTTLPEKKYNASSHWSNPENWERKRQACIECAEKYNIPLIDLAKEFAIDWNAEPYAPGQGYTTTAKTDNQGVYTMDGLHPNEFGFNWISRIVADKIQKIGDL